MLEMSRPYNSIAHHGSTCSSRALAPLPPLIKRSLVILPVVLAPLTNQTPSPGSYYAFHHSLIAYQASQRLCSCVSWKVPRAIRVQPLIYDPLSRSRILDLAKHVARVIRVRTRCHTGAVVQYIRPALPRREQYAVLELVACCRIYRPPADRSRPPLRRGRWVEGFGAWCHKGVEILGYRVVYGGAGEAKEVWWACISVSFVRMPCFRCSSPRNAV